MADYPTIKLNTGAEMPQIGLGTFLAAPGEVGAAVVAALKAGYKHVDCAGVYMNEKEVGEAFSSVFNDPESGVNRADVFITSKLPPASATPDTVQSRLEETLKDLQLEYIDLYLVHNPIPVELDDTYDGKDRIVGKYKPLRGQGWGMQDVWRKMEECHGKGLAKSIGVSNFNAQMTNDLLLYARVPPAVNQIERHPYFQQQSFVDFCIKNDIVITAYAPLGNPGLFSGQQEPLLSNGVVAKIADAHKKTAAQVLIRWAMDTNTIVIPKSSKPHRVQENFDVLDFKLSPEEVTLMATLDVEQRLFAQDWMRVPCFK